MPTKAMRYPRRRFTRRRRSGNIKYIQLNQNTPLVIAANAVNTAQILTPTSLSNIGMTRTFRIAYIEGHLTIETIWSGTVPNGLASTQATYYHGAYIDPDDVSANSLQPASQGFTTRWWWWRAGTLYSYVCGNGTTITSSDQSASVHRYNLRRLTRYKRKMDPSTDSMLLVINNSANSTSSLRATYTFRILAIEG